MIKFQVHIFEMWNYECFLGRISPSLVERVGIALFLLGLYQKMISFLYLILFLEREKILARKQEIEEKVMQKILEDEDLRREWEAIRESRKQGGESERVKVIKN